MTRQDVNDKIYDLTYQREITETEIYELTHKMLDDFESRTCENCKYQQHEVCVNDESPMRGDFVSVDYGCNKFEPKEVS